MSQFKLPWKLTRDSPPSEHGETVSFYNGLTNYYTHFVFVNYKFQIFILKVNLRGKWKNVPTNYTIFSLDSEKFKPRTKNA